MSIFSNDVIAANDLYSSVMNKINEQYIDCGSPTELQANQSTTTGNHRDPFWQAGSLGDWENQEDVIADKAQDQLNAVYMGLNIYGNGGICHYYTTTEWNEFICKATEVIDDYNNESAFEVLCGLDWLDEIEA